MSINELTLISVINQFWKDFFSGFNDPKCGQYFTLCSVYWLAFWGVRKFVGKYPTWLLTVEAWTTLGSNMKLKVKLVSLYNFWNCVGLKCDIFYVPILRINVSIASNVEKLDKVFMWALEIDWLVSRYLCSRGKSWE